jgi:hypothetical protein
VDVSVVEVFVVLGLGFRGPPCFLAGLVGSIGCARLYFVVMRV